MPDTLTEGGADDLARRIERYWRDRGKEVAAWVDELHCKTPERERGRYYIVRSDMRDGLPCGRL